METMFNDEELMKLLNSIDTYMAEYKPRPSGNAVEVTRVSPFNHKGVCGAVAFSIAFNVEYNEALDLLSKRCGLNTKGSGTQILPFTALLAERGWRYHRAKGKLANIDLNKLPKRCIIHTARHVVACIDGTLKDQFTTYNQAGCKLVKGYWAPI